MATESLLFISLSIIALASILSLIIYKKFKIPAVIILVIVGMFIGPGGFSLIRESELINILAEIGVLLLFFSIGMEYNFGRLKKLGLAPYLTFVFELLFVFFLSYTTASLLGFSKGASLIIGIVFAITSTALIIRLLKEMNLINGRENETSVIVATSFLEDLVIIFLLSTITSIAIGKNISVEYITFSIVKALIIVIGSIILLQKILPRIVKALREVSEETIYFLTISLLLGLSSLAGFAGLSVAVGAFIAGNIVSSLPHSREIEKFVSTFSILFVSIFFLSIGMKINFLDVIKNFGIILLFSLVVVVGKIVGVSTGMLFSGFNLRSSLFGGISMVPVGEVSLYIALTGLNAGLLTQEFLGITSWCVIITSVASYFLLKNEEKIYGFTKSIIGESGERALSKFSYLTGSIFGLKSKLSVLLGKRVWEILLNFLLASVSLVILPVVLKYGFSENIFLGSFLSFVIGFLSIYFFYRIAKIFFEEIKIIGIKFRYNIEIGEFFFLVLSLISLLILSIVVEEKFISSILATLMLLIFIFLAFNLMRVISKYSNILIKKKKIILKRR